MVKPKAPVSNRKAELAVIGSCLISPEATQEVMTLLSPGDMYDSRNKMVTEAVFDLQRRNVPIDYVTVTEELTKRGNLDACGGIGFIVELSNAVPSAANAMRYAGIVKEKSLLRQAQGLLASVGDLIDDGTGFTEVIEKLAQSVIGLQEADKTATRLSTMAEIVGEVLDRVSEARKSKGILGLETGHTDIDHLLGGLKAGDLIIVGGRPSMGKTSLLRKWLMNLGISDIPAGMFSLEMTKEDVVQQMLFEAGELESHKLNQGFFSDEDERILRAVAKPFESFPIWLDDLTGLNMTQISAKARRMKMEHDIQFLGVDFLQLIGASTRGQDERTKATEAARGLKQIARELQIPVVALSQLSRDVEKRENKRPMLSDLMESGNIEAAADVVAFVYRDAYYNQSGDIHEAEFIVAKHRKGKIGTRKLYWEPNLATFRNIDRRHSA